MSNLEGLHALIIDDDPMGADVLKNMLARLSMTGTAVDSYADMKSVVEGLPQLDIIFLDLEMPGYNGYDVMEMLHAIPRAMSVPVVAYTTHISHVQQVKDAGFHSFIGKPLNRAEFPEQVERILSGESVWSIP